MKRPLIGITIAPPKQGAPFLQQRASYPRSIEVAGGLPVMIPPCASQDTLHDLLERLDGIVFPGGPDVEPAKYGQAREPRTDVVDELDRLEFAAARWALDSDVPILGICRGQQMLNVLLGGTLIQHLDDHRQIGDRTALTQPLKVLEGSRLANVLGTTRLGVNHMHHQAVRDIAPGLKAVAWTDDGIIEGMERADDRGPWLLMVQFHPEELVETHEPSQRLFTAFVEACSARIGVPAASLR